MADGVQDVVHNQSISTWVCQIGNQNKHTDFDTQQEVFAGGFEPTIVLATACVKLQNGLNITEPCRALMDTGAQINLINKDCVTRLKLPAIRCQKLVSGIAGDEVLNEKVKVFIRSIVNDNWYMEITLYVINEISGFFPQWSSQQWCPMAYN